MLAIDIIKNARYKLSDTNPQRWTDERLLALLNDGLAEITKKTILFIETLYVELINEQVDYDLSDYAFKILRVEYEDKPVDAFSFSEMDKRNTNWQTEEGTKVKGYVLGNQKAAHIKIYPKIKNSVISNIDFGGVYGIITGITYSDLQLNVSGVLGDLGEVAEDGFLKVYYIKKHTKITDINTEIEVNDIAESLLGHYIAGYALRDNQDTQNRALGNEEISLYENKLTEYTIQKAANFSSFNFVSPYNPMGV